jgi:hypothetical protein
VADDVTHRPSQELPVEAGVGVENDEVNTFPDLVYKEFLCALIVIMLFIILAVVFRAPLLEMADPSLTPNPSKAPWYFVGLQELLVYFDPWIAGMMIPLLIVVGLMLIPYLDTNPEGAEEYSFRKRKFAVIVFTAGLAFWFILMAIGYYMRGTDWQLYWPWESRETVKKGTEELWSFPLYGGILFQVLYFGLGIYLPVRLKGGLLRALGRARYVILLLLLLLMGGVVIKIVLRLTLGVKYILATPWFNI